VTVGPKGIVQFDEDPRPARGPSTQPPKMNAQASDASITLGRADLAHRSDLRRGRLPHGFDRPFEDESERRGSGSLAFTDDHCV
jgi:hypothetical protein